MSPAIRLGERDLQCSNKNKWANRERRNAHYVMSIKLARAFFLFNTSLPNATATTTTTHVGLFFFLYISFVRPSVCPPVRSFVDSFVRWFIEFGTEFMAHQLMPIVPNQLSESQSQLNWQYSMAALWKKLLFRHVHIFSFALFIRFWRCVNLTKKI